MSTIAIGYGKFRTPDWLDGIKILPGAQKTYEWIVMSARGQDHAYPKQEWLAKKVKVTVRTIRNYIRRLVKLMMIEVREEWIKGKKRKAYYILDHPAMGPKTESIPEGNSQVQDSCSQRKNEPEEEDDRKNFPVMAENFSAPLDKRKSCLETPPYPPRGKAADAAGESHEYTQTIAAPPDARGGQEPTDFCHTRRMEGENGRDIPLAAIGRERSNDPKRDERIEGPGNSGSNQAKAASIWPQALEILKHTVSEHDLALWLNPLKAGIRCSRFVLFCPDPYFEAYVRRHFFEAIQTAVGQAGITDFSQQDLVIEDRISPVIVQQRIQKKNQEEGWRKLNSLPAKEQFAALAAAYPRKSVGEYFAWRTFFRLRRQGELPDMEELLRIVDEQKSSTDWNRDNGRWIPGLTKWLRNRPWWNNANDEERGSAGSVYRPPR